MSTLYVIGAPQGDPAGLTLRAIRILGQVALVVAENVGCAQRLLDYHQIATTLSGADVPQEVLDGGDVALLISGHSPGGTKADRQLVRSAHQRGLPVVPVPGPSLTVTALVVSGLPTDGFVYLGELPPQGAERRGLLAHVASERRTLVIQTGSAHLAGTLSDLNSALDSRPLCIVTASGTENAAVFRGTLDEAIAAPLELPGSEPFILVIGGHRQKKIRWSEEQLHTELQAWLAEGQPAKEIARALAAESGWPRREIYRMAVDGRQSSA